MSLIEKNIKNTTKNEKNDFARIRTGDRLCVRQT